MPQKPFAAGLAASARDAAGAPAASPAGTQGISHEFDRLNLRDLMYFRILHGLFEAPFEDARQRSEEVQTAFANFTESGAELGDSVLQPTLGEVEAVERIVTNNEAGIFDGEAHLRAENILRAYRAENRALIAQVEERRWVRSREQAVRETRTAVTEDHFGIRRFLR